jgi:hypothetical protein
MKTILIKTFIFCMVGFIVLGCKKDHNELPVEFKFRLLDTLGNEKTTFKRGENIIFSFQVINKTSEDLILGNFFPNDDFFRVYGPNTYEGTLDYGRPYEAYIKIGSFSILSDDTLKIEYPWAGGIFWNEKFPILSNENANESLPVGSLYTEFTQSFKINDIQTGEMHFRINFNVE